jgi:hypothetical protein
MHSERVVAAWPTGSVTRERKGAVCTRTYPAQVSSPTLAPHDVAALTQQLRTVAFTRGHTIFSQGQPAKCLYIIETGKVKVGRLTAQGRIQLIMCDPLNMLRWRTTRVNWVWRCEPCWPQRVDIDVPSNAGCMGGRSLEERRHLGRPGAVRSRDAGATHETVDDNQFDIINQYGALALRAASKAYMGTRESQSDPAAIENCSRR